MELHHKTYYRPVRKDGSCFYRSYIFRLLEKVQESEAFEEKFHLIEKIKESDIILLLAGFERFVFEDSRNIFISVINLCKQKDTFIT